MKALNVQKITYSELKKHWGSCVDISFRRSQELFIRSNAKGVVNYDKAPVYTWDEIEKEQKRRPVFFTVPSEIFEMPKPLINDAWASRIWPQTNP